MFQENEDNDEDGKEKDVEEGEEESEESKKTPKKEIIEVPEENPVIGKLPEQIEELITGLELGDEEDDKKDYPIVVNEELRQVRPFPNTNAVYSRKGLCFCLHYVTFVLCSGWIYFWCTYE